VTGPTEEWREQVAAIREEWGRWLGPPTEREPGAALQAALVRDLMRRLGQGAAVAHMPPPARGLHLLGMYPQEDGAPVLRLLCDCGRPAELALRPADPEGRPVPFNAAQVKPQEVAFTCEGCGSVHWLRIGPPGESL
jgi:hypothetical protein